MDAQYERWGVIFAPRDTIVEKAKELLEEDRVASHTSELGRARLRAAAFKEYVRSEIHSPMNQLCQRAAQLARNTIKYK